MRGKLLPVILLAMILIISACGREEEEALEETHAENGNDQDAEEEPVTEEEELENEAPAVGSEDLDEAVREFAQDPGEWAFFNEDNFLRLIENRRYTNSYLSYNDFNEGIDYHLMMVEEQVKEVFGSPNSREEDPFAFQMYLLEYDGLQVHINDYDHGLYATGFYITSSEIDGPRGTKVGQSLGEVLLSYPLPMEGNYTVEEGQVYWGEETMYYSTHMAVQYYMQDYEITELRYSESNGFTGVVYQLNDGRVESIYFFEMN